MVSNLLIQGLELMLLGMGIVFAFLTTLVFSVRGMSLLAKHLDDTPPGSATPHSVSVSNDRQIVAVISVAVARYRASRAA